jgi:hypothetical protein
MQQPYNHDCFSKISKASTALQSPSFLKNIKIFLCKWKLVNNCSIPSTHTERKITIRSQKHSFTPYPTLSPCSWTDRMTDRGTNTLAVRGLEELFFPVVLLCQFLVLAGNRFWFYILMYLEKNTVVALCSFFGSGKK